MGKIPLAEELRPQSLEEVIGQPAVIGSGKILTEVAKQGGPVNLIFWGPPGTGKTTLARILARSFGADFVEVSAVTNGKKDVVEVTERARQNWNLGGRTVLFVDEIHRWNKAQQDALLPHVESGLITLIGATTENPSFEVIAPLLSRSRVVVLEALSQEALVEIVERAVARLKVRKRVSKDAIDYLAQLAAGDARVALSNLELALSLADKVDVAAVERAAQKVLPQYDKGGEMHYNIISAFIKSMRGSDTEAALYYLARMLQAGEDPKFIARRMVIFASEDVGLAGNSALSFATNVFQAVNLIGMPESEIILAHGVYALCKAEKSRVSYDALQRAKVAAASSPNAPVPLVLRNAPTKLMKELKYGEGQKWAAGFHHEKSYLPDGVKPFL
jgi:putative ATPase